MIAIVLRVAQVWVLILVVSFTGDIENRNPKGMSLTAVHTMHEMRASHTATMLRDGSVLITGGFKKGPDGYSQLYFASAELFDPASRTFREAGRMKSTRCGHTATLLRDGKVLIAGGFGDEGVLSRAELYDPVSRSFSPLPEMHAPREGHTATLLANGKVLLAGGGEEIITPTAEIFDPASRTFTLTGKMKHPRAAHTANLLPDGRVILIGGTSGGHTILASDELFDPVAGTFSESVSMTVVRYKHAAVTLGDGSILVLGGSDDRDWTGKYNSAEIYNPSAGTFSRIDTMLFRRFKIPNTATLLASGNVVVSGGNKKIEVFDGRSHTFAPAGEFDEPHYYGTATLLGDGSVLVAGGYNSKPQSTDKAWIFKE